MIAVSGLKLRPGEPEQRLPGLAAKALWVPERAILDWKITKSPWTPGKNRTFIIYTPSP